MIYQFDQFRLDDDGFILEDSNGERIDLQPKTLELLLLLVRSPGKLLTKEALIEQVWGGIHVSDTALPFQVRALRNALGDTERPHRLVETVHGKGLRFVGDVQSYAGAPQEASNAAADVNNASEEKADQVDTIGTADADPETETETETTTTPARSNKSIALIAALVVALVLGGIWIAQSQFTETGASVESEYDAAVAVIPFQVAGGDASEAYLGEGIASELASALGNFDRLKVSSSTSAARFATASQTPIAEIGAALGVSHLVEGSVSLENDALRISVRLVEIESDRQVWSETFNRAYTAESILRIQDEIVSATTVELLGQLTSPVQGSGLSTQSTEALDYYLQAEAIRKDKSEQAIGSTIGLLKQAIAADPEFLAAYSSLSLAYRDAVLYGGVPVEEADAGRIEALNRATQINSDDPMVLLAGGANADLDYDLPTAVALYQRALAASPQNAEILTRLSASYRQLGRAKEVRDLLRRARQYDPLNPLVLSQLAAAEFNNGDLEAALEVAKANMQWNGTSSDAQFGLSSLQIQDGDYVQGHELMATALKDNPGYYQLAAIAESIYSRVGMAELADDVSNTNGTLRAIRDAKLGDRSAVETFIAENPEWDPNGDFSGMIYFLLDDFETALPFMKTSIDTLELTGPAGLGMNEVVWYLSFAHVLQDANDPEGEIILEKIEQALEGVTPDSARSYDAFIAGAGARMLRGDEDEAMDWLEAAVEDGHVFVTLIAQHPSFKPLADNARYQVLEQRMETKAAEYRAAFERQIAES